MDIKGIMSEFTGFNILATLKAIDKLDGGNNWEQFYNDDVTANIMLKGLELVASSKMRKSDFRVIFDIPHKRFQRLNTFSLLASGSYIPTTKGRRYSIPTKLIAVRCYFDTDYSIKDISVFLKVKPTTVKSWISSYRLGNLSLSKTVAVSKNLSKI